MGLAELVKMLAEAKAPKGDLDLRAMFYLPDGGDEPATAVVVVDERAESDEAIIMRLARMSRLQYERVRQTWAKQMGIRTG